MPLSTQIRSELPPTGGLPLRFEDFTRSPSRPFAQSLHEMFEILDPILTCSATAAMVVALHALRQREPRRNEVIIPAYTCPLVPLAVKLVPGLRSVLCDTVYSGIDFDPEKLASLCCPRTLAIVSTHLGGRVADVATVNSIAIRHGAAVLEDAAQALGATNGKERVGLAGDAAFFSLAAGKGLTTYEGGILSAKNQTLHAELAAAAHNLLRPSLYWTFRRNLELLGYAFFYTPSRLGLVYGRYLRRMLDKGNEEAAIGDFFTLKDIPLHSLDIFRQRVAANAIERLPLFLEDAATRAENRLRILLELEGIRIITDRPGTRGVWPFFMVLMPSREQRDAVLGKLWRAGLGVTKLFTRALPDYSFLVCDFESGRADCPNAKDIADRMLTISNTRWLKDRDFTSIVAVLKESL